MTVQLLQNGDVCLSANGQSSQFWSVNFLCRIDGRTADQIGQRNSHAQKLGHHIAHVQNCEIACVQVGGHRVRDESLLDCRHGISKPEAPCSVAHIENDTAVSRLLQDGINFPVNKDGELLRKNMSMYISGPGLLENELGITSLGARPEIIHHRNFCCCSASDGAIYGSPTGMQLVQWFLRPVVSGFHSYDDVRVS